MENMFGQLYKKKFGQRYKSLILLEKKIRERIRKLKINSIKLSIKFSLLRCKNTQLFQHLMPTAKDELRLATRMV